MTIHHFVFHKLYREGAEAGEKSDQEDVNKPFSLSLSLAFYFIPLNNVEFRKIRYCTLTVLYRIKF